MSAALGEDGVRATRSESLRLPECNHVRIPSRLGGGPCRGRARGWILSATDAPAPSRDPCADMTSPPESPPPATPTFRQNLIRVMAVQVGALLLLWLLQSRYSG